ncbi:hypothetical protein [Enterococcus cecorum]|uniref:hypothetical protein n=1 Tax=Enterococcus cecorum TaxID=44008 RepID=UPI0032C45270
MKKTGNALSILYILATLTGLGYFIIAYRTGSLVLWGYEEDITLNNGVFPRIINYAKDIYVVLLAAYLFFKENKYYTMQKDWFYLFFAILLGTALAFISGNGLLCIVGGIRAYLFSFVVYCYCWNNELAENFWTRFLRAVEMMILLQVVGVIIQAGLAGGRIQLGSGAYRMMGLFTNAGTLGFFSLGAVIYLCYAFLNNKATKVELWLFSLISIFLALASGTRSCVIYAAIIILVTVMEKSRLNQISKIIAIPLIAIVVLVVIVSNLTAYVGRGNLMESGSGRFKAWNDLFDLKFWQIIFGTGLGAGTNSARSLGASSIEMDSSFTVFIVQYGIWGFTLFITQMIKVFQTVYRNSIYKWYALALIGVTVLILFSGSLFEQYAFVIPLIIVFCSLYKGEKIGN